MPDNDKFLNKKPYPMLNPLKDLILFCFCVLSLISCASVLFSKEEQAFANNLSSILDGARVTINKGVAVNTDSGTFKRFEIEISDLKIDTSRAETQALFARSMPALILLESKIPHLAQYKYVDVTVKSKNSMVTEIRYPLSELYQVAACMNALNGYIYGLQHVNKDSLLYYSDKSILDKVPVDELISTLRNAEVTYGKPNDANLQGFKTGTYKDEPMFLYSVYLIRGKLNNLVEVGINPNAKKVIFYDF
jgi:hypothetical protein